MSDPVVVRVRIGRLVLDGFGDLDRAGQRRLRAAVERELSRQLRRTLTSGGVAAARAHRAPIHVESTRPRAAGAAIAGSVHHSIIGSLDGARDAAR